MHAAVTQHYFKVYHEYIFRDIFLIDPMVILNKKKNISTNVSMSKEVKF